jgi:hypothetical protein
MLDDSREYQISKYVFESNIEMAAGYNVGSRSGGEGVVEHRS